MDNKVITEEQEEIVALYDELLGSVYEINQNIPAVNKRYDELDKKIKSLEEIIIQQKSTIDLFSQKIDDDKKTIERIEQTVEKQNKIISEQESLLSKIVSQIDSSIQKAKKAEQAIEDAKDKALGELVDFAKQTITEMRELTEGSQEISDNLKKLTEQIVPLLDNSPVIDYDDIDTIEGLFDKYAKESEPKLIVVKDGPRPWSNDYCFVVDSIDEETGTAHGFVFVGGAPHSTFKKTYPGRSGEYKVYNGPSVDLINDYFEQEN